MLRRNSGNAVVDRLEPARERLSQAGARAREGAEVARERVAEVAETVEPTISRSADAAARVGRSAVSLASTIPSLLSKLLALLASLTGDLAERGREVAAHVDPPRSERRRSALRTAAWFAGGFTAGAATGWIVHARLQTAVEHDHGTYDGPAAASPYGEDAEIIDARRENAPLN